MARLETMEQQDLVSQSAIAGSDGLFELGLMYASGRDCDIDLIAAHKWFNLAALRGNEAARQYRQEIAAALSKPEVARAQRMAREWLARH
jgi:TPR repeat protein